jgi:preprotein translocase subunit YajC
MESLLMQLAHPAVLLAVDQAAGQGAKQEPQSGVPFLLPLMVLLFVVFYLMILRPQKRDQARRQEMLSGVKQNDHVVTIGGIYGVVTKVDRETDQVTIRIDETNNTKIRVTMGAIARIMGDEPSDEAAKK